VPAQVVNFRKVSRFPAIVYLDTNYLLYLQSFVVRPKDPRYRACKQFYDRMVGNGVSMLTSILAIEEAIYIILYRDRLPKELPTVKRKDGKPYSTLDELRTAEPSKFKSLLQKNFPFVDNFVRFVRTLGVKIDYPPEYTSAGLSMSEDITAYAISIMKKYQGVQPMDAFHIAISEFLGIDHIVTHDKGFREVDGITVLTYR
jgi:predicted nucleic acid-binding protein